jgi:hypothetical protein
MKNLALILFFILATSIHAQAQRTATATMRVSATIVSGATLSNSEMININLKNNLMAGGTISLVTPQNIETEIEVNDTIVLKNQFGETIEFSSESIKATEAGRTTLELLTSPLSSPTSTPKGIYTGELIASVQYL